MDEGRQDRKLADEKMLETANTFAADGSNHAPNDHRFHAFESRDRGRRMNIENVISASSGFKQCLEKIVLKTKIWQGVPQNEAIRFSL